MTQEIEKAKKIIQDMLSLDDPVSLSEAQRKEIYSFADFFECDVDSLNVAFSEISDVPSHGQDLFNFSLATKIQHEQFRNTNFVWEKYGLPKEPVLLNVKFDKIRESGDFYAEPISIAMIERVLKENPNDQWSNHYLPILRSFDSPIVYVLYTDDDLSRKHGFPFDIGILLSLPEFDDDSQVIQLLAKCLRDGFNVLDTYQLFKFEKDSLQHSFEKMTLSGRFDIKQLDYILSLLAAKPILETMLEEDVVSKGFTKNDRKRYTEICFDVSSGNYTTRLFSERGLLKDSTKKLPNFTIMNELAERTAEQNDGDHLIRFFNETYISQYNNMMWVPVLLRGGELSFPRPESYE